MVLIRYARNGRFRRLFTLDEVWKFLACLKFAYTRRTTEPEARIRRINQGDTLHAKIKRFT